MIDSSQWICNLVEPVFLKIILNVKKYCWKIDVFNNKKALMPYALARKKAKTGFKLKLSF